MPFILLLFVLMLSSIIFGQTSVRSEVLPNVNHLAPQDEVAKQKKDKKRKDEFKVYAGVNFNNLNISSEKFNTTTGVGWLLGATHKRGKFFYWEIGARFNNPVYNLDDASKPVDSTSLVDGIFSVKNVDIPVTFGINVPTFVSRIVGLRVFVSAVPSFALGIGGVDSQKWFNFISLSTIEII